MVKLFEKKALKETMDGFGELQELYKISGTPNGIYSYPMFAFGLWEERKKYAQAMKIRSSNQLESSKTC